MTLPISCCRTIRDCSRSKSSPCNCTNGPSLQSIPRRSRKGHGERGRLDSSKREPIMSAMNGRRFPPPWSVEEGDNYFVVRDREGQQLAYVHFDNPRAAAKPLTRDEARRVAAN